MPALRWAPDAGFSHEAPVIDASLELDAAGFIIFGGPAEDVRRLTDELIRRAGRPLLIGADLERGAGQQFAGLTELPPPAALAELDDLAAIRWAAATTAREARSVGVNWVFAPVADLDVLAENPIVQTRSFGADPLRASACVAAWVAGCQEAGALACAKHYPGHGRTALDSHAALPAVETSATLLHQADEAPFRAAIGAGVASVMTAHVAFPRLDPAGLPATRSPVMLRHLRQSLGFDGMIVTDALIMAGARAGTNATRAAVDAVVAGVDVLLYPSDVVAVHAELERAAMEGVLTERRMEELARRQGHALAMATMPVPPPASGPFASADDLADAILGEVTLRAPLEGLMPPLELSIVDDDLGGPYPPVPSDEVERELRELGVPLGRGGSRVVLAYAEPRGWKGRAGFGPDAAEQLAATAPMADLIVLFGHPRLARDIPGSAPILVAWHRERLLQRAAARWLARLR